MDEWEFLFHGAFERVFIDPRRLETLIRVCPAHETCPV
jgi:hypothetical protein